MGETHKVWHFGLSTPVATRFAAKFDLRAWFVAAIVLLAH
jgi:hypothetical protein